MRCVVFAYSQLGHDCLAHMLRVPDVHVAALFTHQDNPDETIWFDSVKDLAMAYDVPVFTPDVLKDDHVIECIRDLKPDAIFSFYYRKMIPEVILNVPPLGAYNMHGSLLPKYRGRCPVNWAIIHGETETGVTLHHMVKAADAGDIVDQESMIIEPAKNAAAVQIGLNHLAVRVLARALPRIADGTADRRVQQHEHATYFGGRTPKDGEIDWHWMPEQISNLVRALQPSTHFPPAFCVIDQITYYVKRVELHDRSDVPQHQGTVVAHHAPYSMDVICGPDGMSIVRVFFE